MDENFKVIDYVNGEKDIKKKVLRMVGDPNKRIKEDPLRIVRAVRFALQLNFEIDPHLEKAMIKHQDLLKLLRKEKIIQDLNKLACNDEVRKLELFNKFGIAKVINVIE